MAKEQPIEIFMPPNVLKAKVGGSGVLDLGAVKRAEAAIEELKEEFSEWIVIDVDHLIAARDAYAKAPSVETLATLYRTAHDLKGQAGTFDFPLVARVASSLCKLTDDDCNPATVPGKLVEAHVNAIKVILRDKIKDASDMMASVLVGELERQVAVFLEKHGIG